MPTTVKEGERLVWCQPMQRKDCQLTPTDITHAITWFREETGQKPALILVHPSKHQMAEENSSGIRVEALGGVLAWEVWLSPTEHFVTPSIARDFFGGQIGEGRHEIKTRPRIPLGRRPTDLPIEKVMQLHGQELGVRAIAKRLSTEGIEVSRMAIHRAIKKAEAKLQLQLPLEDRTTGKKQDRRRTK